MTNLEVKGSLIAGKSVVGGLRDRQPVLNPATGRAIAMLCMATEADVDDAAATAQRGFLAWSSRSPLDRARILSAVADTIRRDADHLSALLTAEQGKTMREARGETSSAADLFEWLSEEGKRIYGRVVSSRTSGVQQHVLLEPVGPVAAFSPWNYPLALAARKVAHALAAGCSVVIKPAEEAPSAVLHMVQRCIECGVPPEAVQVLFGMPALVSERLIGSPYIRKISFTGSVQVGRSLAAMAGRALKKVTFELGGHSAVIVMDDVDVDRTVELSVASKFRNAGQICIAPTRFFVHEAIYDQFVAKFAKRSAALCVGDGARAESDMGPLAHERRIRAIQDLTQDAVSAGARLITGTAERVGGDGFFWAPTVLSDVPASARLMREEPFGPLAPCVRFESLEAALKQANDVEYGLAGYGFTRSLRSARLIQDGLKVGMVGINTYAVSAPEMPFAGTKSSGLGVAHGVEGLLDHMNIKSAYRADY